MQGEDAPANFSRWIYLLEYEDGETKTCGAQLGQAASRQDCEAHVEHALELLRNSGHIVVRAQACELCGSCRGDGKILDCDQMEVRCAACEGRSTMNRLELHPAEAILAQAVRAVISHPRSLRPHVSRVPALQE